MRLRVVRVDEKCRPQSFLRGNVETVALFPQHLLSVTAASTALLAVWRVLALGACLNHRPAGQVIFKLAAESGALTKQGDPITIEGKPRCVKFGVLPTS